MLAAKTDLEAISKRLDSSEPVNTKALDSLKKLLSDGTRRRCSAAIREAAQKAVAEIRKELTTV